jgi:hypothetical protein
MNTQHIAPIAASNIEFTPVAEGLLLPEGPVAMGDGSVLVTEVARGTVTRVSASGAVSVVAELGGGPNGLAIGPDGALYVCNNGGGIRVHPGEQMLHIEFAPELYRGGSSASTFAAAWSPPCTGLAKGARCSRRTIWFSIVKVDFGLRTMAEPRRPAATSGAFTTASRMARASCAVSISSYHPMASDSMPRRIGFIGPIR